MEKRSGIGRVLSEWGARLSLERWERQVLDLESRFIEKHRQTMRLSLPSSPVRQEGIIRYRDMAGWKPIRDELREMRDIMPLYREVIRSARATFEISAKNGDLSAHGAPVSTSFWHEFEGVAYAHGVHLIGYTAVPGEFIFKEKGVLFENAIVLGMEMKALPISRAPSYEAGKETLRVYRDLGYAVIKLAIWLHERGVRAQPVHPYGGTTLFPLMAAKAGLGTPGFHGLLISKRFGPRQRLTIISTDGKPIPPPRENSMADIRDFCEVCRQCIRACPAGAFHDPPIMRHGSKIVTHIDNTKCYPYFARFKSCSVCLKICAHVLEGSGLLAGGAKESRGSHT